MSVNIKPLEDRIVVKPLDGNHGPPLCLWSKEFYETDPSRGYARGYTFEIVRGMGPADVEAMREAIRQAQGKLPADKAALTLAQWGAGDPAAMAWIRMSRSMASSTCSGPKTYVVTSLARIESATRPRSSPARARHASASSHASAVSAQRTRLQAPQATLHQ